jgi:hypothetical protein
LNDADYIFGDGLDARISFGALLEIFLVIANIATAVVFFPILKRVNETVDTPATLPCASWNRCSSPWDSSA